MREDALTGRQLANFHVERLIGRGGMAQVYYGRDVVLDRPVAIKVMSSRYRDEPGFTERFVREARSVARWNHPNVVQIHYAGEEEGLHFLVMEYVSGPDLKSVLDELTAEGRLLEQEEVLRIGRGVAAALDYAHENGVIHRDIKPGNVLIANDGRVVLTDFGLALDTTEGSSGVAFGSPRYIAPEQARSSRAVVPQSDLYSLGVMLYEMLTGRVPFDDPSPTSLAVQHLTEPPPPPCSVNPALNQATEAVLLRALAKQPEARFQSGRELIQALGDALRYAHAPAGNNSHRRTDPQMPAPIRPVTPLQERVAREVERQPFSMPAAVAAERASDRPLWHYLVGSVVLLLLCFVIGAAGTVVLRNLLAGGDPSGTPSPTRAENVTDGGSSAGSSGEVPPDTPAEEAAPTATLPAAPPAAGMQLIYNSASFYAWNTGSTDIAMRDLLFEALHENGNPAGFSFAGNRWSAFYPWLQPGNCASLEIISASGRLRPARCRGYNATVTPEASDTTLFWIPREGVGQFRVLWHGEEVARCPLSSSVPEEVTECPVNAP